MGDSTAIIFVTLMLGAITNNIVLNQGLGLCSFLGVSKKTSNAFGMSMAVIFVLVLSSLIIYFIQHAFIAPFKLEFMSLIVFILVIASVVQLLDIMLKKTSPTLYNSLGVYLPLIATNCAVLYVANVVAGYDMSALGIAQTFVLALFSGIGYTMAILLMSGVRERLALGKIPKIFQGFPITLIAAGIMAMAFMGFSGLSFS